MNNKKASELKEVELDGNGALVILEKYGSHAFQRRIKPENVKEYARRMAVGDFLGDSTLVFAIDKQAKKRVLIDGYNRMNALSTLGPEFTLGFLMRYYVCEDGNEIEKLYEACDSLARTKEDYVAVKAKRIGLDLKGLALSWTVNYAAMVKSDVRPDGVAIEYTNPARTFRRTIVKAYYEGAKGWWGATSEKRMIVAIMFQNALKAWLSGKNLEVIKHSNSVFDWDGADIKKLAAKRNK